MFIPPLCLLLGTQSAATFWEHLKSYGKLPISLLTAGWYVETLLLAQIEVPRCRISGITWSIRRLNLTGSQPSQRARHRRFERPEDGFGALVEEMNPRILVTHRNQSRNVHYVLPLKETDVPVCPEVDGVVK